MCSVYDHQDCTGNVLFLFLLYNNLFFLSHFIWCVQKMSLFVLFFFFYKFICRVLYKYYKQEIRKNCKSKINIFFSVHIFYLIRVHKFYYYYVQYLSLFNIVVDWLYTFCKCKYDFILFFIVIREIIICTMTYL